ncbi:MAG: hypothetical protein V2G42_04535 [bacterium JZ-2024 1]
MKGTATAVWAAMIADVAVFFAVGMLLAPRELVIIQTLANLILLLTAAFSFLNFVLVSAVKNIFAQLAALNSIAFYGLLLALLGFPFKVYGSFYLVALVGMVLKRPVERATG